MTIKTIRKKRPLPAKELAEAYDVSVRTIYRWNSQTREDWIDEQATLRESIRAYHDDDGHSWAATAEHFNMTQGAVRAAPTVRARSVPPKPRKRPEMRPTRTRCRCSNEIPRRLHTYSRLSSDSRL